MEMKTNRIVFKMTMLSIFILFKSNNLQVVPSNNFIKHASRKGSYKIWDILPPTYVGELFSPIPSSFFKNN